MIQFFLSRILFSQPFCNTIILWFQDSVYSIILWIHSMIPFHDFVIPGFCSSVIHQYHSSVILSVQDSIHSDTHWYCHCMILFTDTVIAWFCHSRIPFIQSFCDTVIQWFCHSMILFIPWYMNFLSVIQLSFAARLIVRPSNSSSTLWVLWFPPPSILSCVHNFQWRRLCQNQFLPPFQRTC